MIGCTVAPSSRSGIRRMFSRLRQVMMLLSRSTEVVTAVIRWLRSPQRAQSASGTRRPSWVCAGRRPARGCSADPAVATPRPVTSRRRAVGPSRPKTVPWGICRSMPSSARVDPKVFTRPSASTANADIPPPRWNPLGRCDGIWQYRQKARGFGRSAPRLGVETCGGHNGLGSESGG
jgi:hypothetical protein